jgi:hypothetical protein
MTTLIPQIGAPTATYTTHLILSPTSTSIYHNTYSLSTSAAMGIGLVIGSLGTIVLLSTMLLIHRRWKLHRSHPLSIHNYRQAKLWRGFEPVTPSTTRAALGETKRAGIYFPDSPMPVAPAFFVNSPQFRGTECADEHCKESAT